MEVAHHQSVLLINKSPNNSDLALAKCYCCGFTEECTEEYIKLVRERYSGQWMCGLCGKAVMDELVRSSLTDQETTEEALNKHMSFCKTSNTHLRLSPPKEELIYSVKHLLLKSLDSPRSSSMKKKVKAENVLARCESCFPVFDV